MKILLFEYFTASNNEDCSIMSEAEAMIKSLSDDLKDFEIYLLTSENFFPLFKDYQYLNIISIKENLFDWLNKNVYRFNKVMFIGTEEDMILYELTKLIESKGVEILGSDSKGVLTCSNKYETYMALKDKITQPKTIKMDINSEDYQIIIKDILNKSDSKKLIVKPVYGVDCQNTVLISDESEIANLNKNELLIQEFIDGEIVSVSLISDGIESIPISLNKQLIAIDDNKFTYLGGEIPFDHPLKDEAFKIAIMAVEAIVGLKGFLGVDLIITNNKIYFLEINSRFTTSYVGLTKITNVSIGEIIIKLLTNQITLNSINIKLNGKVRFLKNGRNLEINCD
ncbi:MAG: ATP-grasp domain-containing protein [Methanobrevibacter sp.]|jgi:predicted ATP-grasp superfamily ATP-dependent carboligase|nr:ATP-grasp domain-containing protein [Candidatus Methanovirga procula]